MQKFREKIDKLKIKIREITNILNKVKENLEIYYKIYDDIINNNEYNKNYYMLNNIYDFKLNKDIKDIDEIINDNNICAQFEKIINLYTKMTEKNTSNINDKRSEVKIQYKINSIDKKIKLFDINFINNNKKHCKFIYEGKENELREYFDLSNNYYQKDILEIQLIGIENATNLSFMFYECSSLLNIFGLYKLSTINITDISYMFYGCKSLMALPDISNWRTNNIIDMSYLFYECSSLGNLPDISKWNTNKVCNMSKMFTFCSSLESIPNISKWNTSNVTNMNNIFSFCKSLTSLPDISNWNTDNVFDLSI